MVCKHCGAEMERTFSFENGKGYTSYRCINCGNNTRKKDIVYSKNGKVIFNPKGDSKRKTRKDKKQDKKEV